MQVKVLVRDGTGARKWCGDIILWESLITYGGIYGRCEPTGDGDRWWAIGYTIELATACDFGMFNFSCLLNLAFVTVNSANGVTYTKHSAMKISKRMCSSGDVLDGFLV